MMGIRYLERQYLYWNGTPVVPADGHCHDPIPLPFKQIGALVPYECQAIINNNNNKSDPVT